MKLQLSHGFSLALCFLGGLWLGGLLLFVANVNDFAEPEINASLPSTEAIIVLTGGSERLASGFQLLLAGKGKKLFISGVYPGLSLNQLPKDVPIPDNLRDCCITLGHTAGDTLGNAEETANWIKGEKFHSLRLVTAHYHMPRSLLMFKQSLPDIVVTPHPVAPDRVKLSGWWKRVGTTTLLITEYHKYILAVVRYHVGEWLLSLEPPL